MSKPLWIELSVSGPTFFGTLNTYPDHYLSDELQVDGVDAFSQYYVFSNYTSGVGFQYGYDTFSIVHQSSTTPEDASTKTITFTANNGGTETYHAWQEIFVPDNYLIPGNLDVSGLYGGYSYDGPNKTGISVGNVNYNVSTEAVGSATLGGFAASTNSSLPQLFENAANAAGFSGIATAIHNTSALYNALTNVNSNGMNLITQGLAGASDPNFNAAAFDAQVDAYLNNSQKTFQNTVDAMVLIPGNPNADAAAHAIIKDLRYIGTGSIPVNGSLQMGLDINLGGYGNLSFTVTGSANAEVIIDGAESGDTISGTGATNFLIGGTGNNTLIAGKGNDYLNGGGGNDTFVVGQGNDFIDGGAPGNSDAEFSSAPASTSISVDGQGFTHAVAGSQQVTVEDVGELQFGSQIIWTADAPSVVESYEGFLDRLPTASELAYWTSAINSGTPTSAVSAAIASSGASQTSLSDLINGLYSAFLGRVAGPAEIGAWQTVLENGSATLASISTALANSTSTASLQALVTSLYQSYLGRAPGAAEAASWIGELQSGVIDLYQMTLVLEAQPGAASNEIGSIFQAYLGRAPSTAELAALVTPLSSGEITPDQIANSIKSTEIGILYQTFLGRAPTGAELSYWESTVKETSGFAPLRQALASNSYAQAHVSSEVTQLYDMYFGRDPSAFEMSYWGNQIAGGSTYGTLQTALLFQLPAQDRAQTAVHTLYETYLARDATVAELNAADQLLYTGTDISQIRSALVSSPQGVAHTDAEVTSLYQTYLGRSPGVQELGTWDGLVAGGENFAQIRNTLEANPAAQAYDATLIKSGYETYFDRDPGAAEIAAWTNAFMAGTTLDTFIGTLVTNPAVQHDTTILSAGHNSIVSNYGGIDLLRGFAPTDVLTFDGPQFAGFTPLEHAVQFIDAAGQTDVLIVAPTFQSTTLLEGVSLASLGPANFNVNPAIPIDSYYSDQLTTAGQINNYQVDLVAGERYSFALEGQGSGGSTLAQGYLTLSGPGATSQTERMLDGTLAQGLDFTPTVSGVYDLAASSLGSTGSYVIGTQDVRNVGGLSLSLSEPPGGTTATEGSLGPLSPGLGAFVSTSIAGTTSPVSPYSEIIHFSLLHPGAQVEIDISATSGLDLSVSTISGQGVATELSSSTGMEHVLFNSTTTDYYVTISNHSAAAVQYSAEFFV